MMYKNEEDRRDDFRKIALDHSIKISKYEYSSAIITYAEEFYGFLMGGVSVKKIIAPIKNKKTKKKK